MFSIWVLINTESVEAIPKPLNKYAIVHANLLHLCKICQLNILTYHYKQPAAVLHFMQRNILEHLLHQLNGTFSSIQIPCPRIFQWQMMSL